MKTFHRIAVGGKFKEKGVVSVNIGDNLKALQDKAGMTTAQLAEKSNLPVDTINKIRSGATRSPNADTLARLSVALGVPVDVLLAEDGKPQSASGLLPDNTMYQLYLAAMARQKESYELTISSLGKSHAQTLAHVERNSRRWFWVAVVLMAFIVFILVWDITHPTMGYIQY